jgi:hypothetical protein
MRQILPGRGWVETEVTALKFPAGKDWQPAGKMAKKKATSGTRARRRRFIATSQLQAAIQFNRMLQSSSSTQIPVPAGQDTGDCPPARSLQTFASAGRRFLVIAAIAFWLGGFTFYSGVAIPMGVEVLGTHKAVGFITQRVTHWLNVAGVAALSILLLNLLLGWRQAGPKLRRVLLITWLIMVAIEVELFIMHPMLDRLLTTVPVREILDEDRFDLLHRIYLWSTTGQWILGVIHVWCICLLWGRENRSGSGLPVARASASV